MGGNALKTIKTVRLQKKEYFELEKQVTDNLSLIFPGHRVNTVPAYRNKESFGDMDILLESTNLPSDWVERIENTFNPQQLVKNGPVTSFDVQQFQIDVILSPTHFYDFSLSYYSWNDLGNLIGRLAKGMGYTFGHEGFSYKLYNGDQLIDTIKLSTDFNETLLFLGLDPERHRQGFNTVEDIFNYMISSTYFRSESFLLESLNHVARVRTKKRPMYAAFLDFLDNNHQPESERNKPLHLNRGFEAFSSFQDKYNEAEQKGIDRSIIKDKFNGELVSELTGLTQKDLGEFMKQIRSSFESKEEFERFIINGDQKDINDYIVSQIDDAIPTNK